MYNLAELAKTKRLEKIPGKSYFSEKWVKNAGKWKTKCLGESSTTKNHKQKTKTKKTHSFEAEISKSHSAAPRFVPNQVRQPIIASTYHHVQQKHNKLPNNPTISAGPQPPSNISQPIVQQPQIAPAFINTFTSTDQSKGDMSQVVLSSAPKLYQSPKVTAIPAAPQVDVNYLQYDVSQKLKKLKSEKTPFAGPNSLAEEVIRAAKASSALQSFQTTERRKKDRKTVRVAGGSTWEDQSLADWPEDDFRIFCGDLGNDVNDEVLTRTFNKYSSFQKAKVIRDKRTGKSKGFGFLSFREPQDFIRAMKEMDGRYVGSRPIKLRKSTWRQRSIDLVRKKEKEKQTLLQAFNTM